MRPIVVLWVYIVLLVIGGVMGFVKAKSKASLISSLCFGVALALCALGVLQAPVIVDILMLVLLLFFGFRFAKGKKFMPAGFMVILTVVALALRHF